MPDVDSLPPLQDSTARGRWRKLAIVLAVLAVLGWLLALALRPSPSTPQRSQPPRITHVSLPPPPPPPPPPPKPEPEPPKPQPRVQDTPVAAPDPTPPKAADAPPGDPLTAAAGPGDNPFGLQAGNGGGTRIGGGGGGNPFAAYAASVQRAVQTLLQRDATTRKGRYRATVAVWLDRDGSIARAQIVASAGTPELDAAITRALLHQPLPQSPPPDLPQPIQLRIGALAPG
ncbi:TonB C-terminal domain-containing protein [Xanthomonas maliensis]|uniref:TonB C-terminal domain-containing protein n=1 Tax=Xanthomonas maliensis TaxID=1321368 RepID=UPI0003A960AC|nr:TonB C-terminal domain-containing protein [Xanthomonas maliensis]